MFKEHGLSIDCRQERHQKILDICHVGEVDFTSMHTHTESTVVVYHRCLLLSVTECRRRDNRQCEVKALMCLCFKK